MNLVFRCGIQMVTVFVKCPLSSYRIISGKYADYLRDNIDEINLEYNFKLVSKPKCVEIKARAGKCCKNADSLQVDQKYRIYLRTKVRHDQDLEEGAPKTHFFLTR